MANILHSPQSLEGIIGHSFNFSGVWDPPLSLILGKCDDPGIASSADSTSVDPPFAETWSFQFIVALAVMLVLLLKLYLTFRRSTPISKAPGPTPPAVPYLIPLLGNLVSYLRDAAKLASLITQQYGASSIVRLNFLSKDIFVVSGADYLNAIWKNTKGLTSTNGINIALQNMFDTSKQDMKFFEADKSGITHDPHPQSSTAPENRVFFLMHKGTVDCLAGSHVTIAAQRFQAALTRRMSAIHVQHEWVEMDDLFSFLRPLISCSTIDAMCGTKFLEMFPDFVESFWKFNTRMPRLLQGWPRWTMPKAWHARDRCISIMKQWRKTSKYDDDFDGNAMIQRRWDYFSRIEGLSDDGVACSDLGILWGMNSNSMPATFWLFWHMVRDRPLLSRATAEINACRMIHAASPLYFDINKLCNQALLQSSYAEVLRLYIAVYIIRKPEYEDARILDYVIPKDKMIVISSAMAHMDRRNWNLGSVEKHSVENFWAYRFLTYGSDTARPTTKSRIIGTDSTFDDPISTSTANPPSTASTATTPPPSKARFSLNGYSGAWIPFGGGIHQCPGRHWVKLQMLLSFAMINAAFDIELLEPKATLNVDKSKYGLGALQPAEKARFRIRRKEGAL